ncbi:MAG: hypothetical protein IT261_08260 [Saprospiraceae bacterium]|nr:hypothetical protein [Saprospiraceae bacterium]
MNSFLVPIILLVTFYTLFQLVKLSIAIAKERNPEQPQESVMEAFSKPINKHLWIGPFFSEHGDSERVQELIKKRNRWVAIFWSIMILGLLVSLTLETFNQL